MTLAQKYLEQAEHTPDCKVSDWNKKVAEGGTKKSPPKCTCGLQEVIDCFEGTYLV